VVEVGYAGKRSLGSWGRTYRYTADLETHTLSLGTATKPRSFRLGGFDCQRAAPATYTWSRFDRNYILRLTAVQEPCAVRRTILEGEWHFID
jgi:hypothetical protein